MDKELIERLAKETGWASEDFYAPPTERLAHFAALVAEECAKECDQWQSALTLPSALGAERSAAAIRAKFPAPANTPVIPPLQPKT